MEILEITLKSQSKEVELKLKPDTELIVYADFPLDNIHHASYSHMEKKAVVLHGTYEFNGHKEPIEMKIYDGNNPYPNYNPGKYIWKLNDEAGDYAQGVNLIIKIEP